jgi:hypothetical protein
LAWAKAPCKEHPTYSVLGHSLFLKIIVGFSNISDPENCFVSVSKFRHPR